MKKLIFIIILIFPFTVFSEENISNKQDIIEINNMHITLFVGNENAEIFKRFNTKITYGKEPDTNSLKFNFPQNKGDEIKWFSVDSKQEHTIFNDNYGRSVIFNEFYNIFPETENFELSYSINYGKENKDKTIILTNVDYDMNGLEFVIYGVKKNEKVGFSIDGKNYNLSLDKFNIIENGKMYGRYDKLLKEGTVLYLKILDKSKVNKEVTVLITLLMIVLLLTLFFTKLKKLLIKKQLTIL